MKMSKILLLSLIVILTAAFFLFDLNQYLSLEYLSAQRDSLQAYAQDNPVPAAAAFVAVYVLVTALSLPGAAVMTLLGGAVFGLALGTLLVSLASTLGATLAFLASRLLLRDWVQARFGDSLGKINEGIRRQGAFFLFGLRLVPLFPFFIINLVMGLTPLPARQFFWVSMLGMLPGTILYVNAGTQLGQLQSLAGILSPEILLSFLVLALFPLLARHLMDRLDARKRFRPFQKPRHFDNNLIVIGAGSAGLVASYIAAAIKAKVTLIEKHKMGGDCLNTGCVPSKTLIRSAKIAHEMRHASRFGIGSVSPSVDFGAVMERVQQVVRQIEPNDSVQRYTQLGVNCIEGEARIIDPWRVQVNGQTLTARNLVIATGARPLVPPLPGLEKIQYYTSENLWSLRHKPDRLLILGGGPIGCELAQAFQRLGVQVVQVDRAERILPKEDADAAAQMQAALVAEGVDLRLGREAQAILPDGPTKRLRCLVQGRTEDIAFDEILIAVGRRANTEGLGLEQIPVGLNKDGTLQVNDYLQTDCPNIYACGDVAGPFQFTHTASHQAWYAAVNSLFSGFRRFRADYRVIPWCTFTDPEVARVGLNEQDAQAQGIQYEVTRYRLDDLDRAITEGNAQGFVKVLTVPGKDKILGVTIVGAHAGELITEFVTAMKQGLGLNKILGTIHIYPTFSEANKFVAGNWKKAHAPVGVLRWLGKFHGWRRGRQRIQSRNA